MVALGRPQERHAAGLQLAVVGMGPEAEDAQLAVIRRQGWTDGRLRAFSGHLFGLRKERRVEFLLRPCHGELRGLQRRPVRLGRVLGQETLAKHSLRPRCPISPASDFQFRQGEPLFDVGKLFRRAAAEPLERVTAIDANQLPTLIAKLIQSRGQILLPRLHNLFVGQDSVFPARPGIGIPLSRQACDRHRETQDADFQKQDSH